MVKPKPKPVPPIPEVDKQPKIREGKVPKS